MNKYTQEKNLRQCNWFGFYSLKPVWGVLTDLVMETGCATGMGLVGGMESAAVTTDTKGSSA